VAKELAVRPRKPKKSLKKSKTSNGKKAQPAKQPEHVTNAEPGSDPRLTAFITEVQTFARTATGLAQAASQKNDVAASDSLPDSSHSKTSRSKPSEKTERYAGIAAASVHLPSMITAFPESLQAASRSVLPSSDSRTAAPDVWAPILAWIALRAFPSPTSSLALYDELRLRHALAETFSTVGLHGEQTWRAAAMVRVLLRMNTESSPETAIRSEEFWHDPDVRWLAGINSSAGKEYLHQEEFEALICWLQLPALVAIAQRPAAFSEAANEISATAVVLTRAAKRSGYDLRVFLELLHTENTEDKSDISAKSSTTLPEHHTV
jgi:hypothetical protein